MPRNWARRLIIGPDIVGKPASRTTSAVDTSKASALTADVLKSQPTITAFAGTHWSGSGMATTTKGMNSMAL